MASDTQLDRISTAARSYNQTMVSLTGFLDSEQESMRSYAQQLANADAELRAAIADIAE